MFKPKFSRLDNDAKLSYQDKECLEVGVESILEGKGSDATAARFNRAKREFLLNICRESLMTSLKNAMTRAFKTNIYGYNEAMKAVRATLKKQGRDRQ
ncbi:MAG: hypothetical protein WA087_03230 [Candidatus Saccharimonadales bacterium]